MKRSNRCVDWSVLGAAKSASGPGVLGALMFVAGTVAATGASGQNLAVTPSRTAASASPAPTRTGNSLRSNVQDNQVQPVQALQPRGTSRNSVRVASATGGNLGGVQAAVDQVYQAATAARTVGDIEAALSNCDRLGGYQMDGENEAYVRELKGWLLNRRGEAYSQAATQSLDNGHEQDAVSQEKQAQTDFRSALQIHPHWRAYHNLGVSLAMTGDYESALQSFGKAVELKPDYPNTRFNRAELWLEVGQYQAAEREYSEVLRLNSADLDSRIGRGHARFYLGQVERALQDFDQAVALQPEHAVAYADRADLHAYMQNWQQAAQDYRQAIALDKQLGRVFQSAAWLMSTCPDPAYRDGKWAVLAAERAIELDGTADYRYLDTLAAAQANAGQFPQAVQSVSQAMQLAPEDVRPELQHRRQLYQAQRAYRDGTAVQ